MVIMMNKLHTLVFIMIFIFHTSGPNTLRQFSKVFLFAAENHSSTAFRTKVDLFSFAKN